MLEKKCYIMNIAISQKKMQWTKDLESEQKIGKLTVWNYGKDKKNLRTYVRLLAAAWGLKKDFRQLIGLDILH